MNEDIRTRIALSLVPKVGAHRSRLLLERVDRPRDVFQLSERDLRAIPGFGRVVTEQIRSFSNWSLVDTVIRRTEALQCRLLIPEDAEYPRLLREIDDPPVVLWVRGNVDLLNHAGIAVVGTRSPSPYGKDMARHFTTKLTEQGITIISGLAYGIDTVAHRQALDKGGKTIAVLGSGIDVVYPRQNTDLYDRMIKEGSTVISEFPPGTKPDYMNFPTRNRVVSGLSYGILVVETGAEGGSMITARLALEQNREVFVVPHNLTNTRAAGCHKLIRESSGKLVEHLEDITSEFSWVQFKAFTDGKTLLPVKPEGLSAAASACWDALAAKGELDLDGLSRSTRLSLPQVSAVLLEMELSGLVKQRPGRMFALA